MKLLKILILLTIVFCLSSIFVIAESNMTTNLDITDTCEHKFEDQTYYQFGNQHYRLCSSCNEKIYEQHNYKTTGINHLYHATTCDICGLRVVQKHNEFRSIDDVNHMAKCSICDYDKGIQPHKLELVTTPYGHYYKCLECNYKSSLENHTCQNNICTVCGFDDMAHYYLNR